MQISSHGGITRRKVSGRNLSASLDIDLWYFLATKKKVRIVFIIVF